MNRHTHTGGLRPYVAPVERLESRRLLAAAGITFNQGTLSIVGGAAGDAISVSRDANNASKLEVHLNAITKRFPMAQVKRVSIDARGGNDSVLIDASHGKVAVPTTVLGGAGDDSIVTSAGNDRIDAGDGQDRVDAGAGRDTVSGGAGNDRILGGADDDSLDGGAGNDSVFGDDGRDTVQGGSGKDLVSGGKGVDKVDGGPGTDSFDSRDSKSEDKDRAGDVKKGGDVIDGLTD